MRTFDDNVSSVVDVINNLHTKVFDTARWELGVVIYGAANVSNVTNAAFNIVYVW
jgi:hypothetical protein